MKRDGLDHAGSRCSDAEATLAVWHDTFRFPVFPNEGGDGCPCRAFAVEGISPGAFG